MRGIDRRAAFSGGKALRNKQINERSPKAVALVKDKTASLLMPWRMGSLGKRGSWGKGLNSLIR